MRCDVVVPMSMPTVRSFSCSVATLPAPSCSSGTRPPCAWCAWRSACSCFAAGSDADVELVHLHLNAARGAPLDVRAMDERVLILILDLVPALVDVLVDTLV